MEKQLVRINLPEIKLVVGSSTVKVLEPCTIEIDEGKKTAKGENVNEARQIKSAIKGMIPRNHILKEMKQKMIEELKKGVAIELADGTTAHLAMNHQHGWVFDIPISTSMLNKAAGRHVPVTYANFVHNGLYKLKRGDSLSSEAREELIKLTSSEAKKKWTKVKATLINSVSLKAKATLIELGYIKNDGCTITAAGRAVLDRLVKHDPSTDSSCRMKLTRAMFCRKDPTLPAFEWAKDNGFIESVKISATPRQPWYVYDHISKGNPRFIVPSGDACWYPTEIGAAWLETNAKRILRHHSCSPRRKDEMIPFMPLSYLNEYLSEADRDVRGLAERRLQVIKGPKRR